MMTKEATASDDATQPGAVALTEGLGLVIEALGAYWDVAYAEGLEGRTHDTTDGAAERARRDVMAAVDALVSAERERWHQAAFSAGSKAPAVPNGWALEYGQSGFDDTRWVCIRDLESQCGQDFYEDRDPLIFGFLAAMLPKA